MPNGLSKADENRRHVANECREPVRGDVDVAERPRRDEAAIDLAIRIALLGLLVYWTFILIRPFIVIALWSIVLAVALYPAFRWLSAQLNGRERLAAVMLTIAGLLATTGPVTWLGYGLVENAASLYDRFLQREVAIPPPPASVKGWPLIGDPLYLLWETGANNIRALFVQAAPALRTYGVTALEAAGSVGLAIVSFTASVVLAGFLFCPAASLTESIRAFVSRVSKSRGEQFVMLAGATIRNVSRGVIGIALIQALFAGIGLAVAGIPAASLLTFTVLVAAIVQIGAFVVLIPAMVWSWMVVDTTTAFLFTAYMIPVNMLDNILRPLILGRGLRTPMLVILAGVIGGVLAHGPIGVFVGPIVLAVAWDLLTVWVAGSDGDNGGGTPPPQSADAPDRNCPQGQ